MKIQNGLSLKLPSAEVKASQQDANLKEAAKMYETHFLNEMVKAMRSTVGNEDGGVVKKNFAEKIFTEQLDQQYVDGWSKKGGVGLADLIYNQIKDQYLGGKHIHSLQHIIPIKPSAPIQINPPGQMHMRPIPPSPGSKLGLRFDVQNPQKGPISVQAPLPGVIEKVVQLEQGWNVVNMNHGRGLTSEMTFPGQLTTITVNQSVEPGQKLGILDSERAALAWNLDWS